MLESSQARVHPLVDTLLSLPYFDLLASFGSHSLHPGGLEATARILTQAQVAPGAKVLEVGCGTGCTTQALLVIGLDVSVAEPNERMLKRARQSCKESQNHDLVAYHTSAELLHGVPDHTFDLVLFEAVFGFISDRRAALEQVARVLKPGVGKIAVIDFHYTAEPPADVQADVAAAIGAPIDVLFEDSWQKLFQGWHSIGWSTNFLRPLQAPTADTLRRCWLQSGQSDRYGQLSKSELDAIVARLELQNAAFEANRRYMRGHHAVFLTPVNQVL